MRDQHAADLADGEDMALVTRFTEVFGMRHPIVCGG
jgi:hypothetical protein